MIGDSAFNLKYDDRAMATYTPDIDCGNVGVTFTQGDDSTSIDDQLFKKENRYNFKVKSGTVSKAGYYPIFYYARLNNY